MKYLFIGRSVKIMYILRQFLLNNEECASCNVYGIMRSVHALNLLGEYKLLVEVC